MVTVTLGAPADVDLSVMGAGSIVIITVPSSLITIRALPFELAVTTEFASVITWIFS